MISKNNFYFLMDTNDKLLLKINWLFIIQFALVSI